MQQSQPYNPSGSIQARVSVVIPVFNREEWIEEAIRSTLAQETEFPFEVIVSDDGSTDNTVAIARSFGESVRVLESEHNRGAAAARNAAIRASTSPFIAFLDSDDVMLPGRLQTQIAFLEAHPDVDLVNAAAEHEDGERAEVYYRNRGIDIPHGEWLILRNARPLLARSFFGAPSTTTIRRALVEEIGLFDESIIAREDWELFFRAASATAFGCCNRPYAWMRTSHAGRYGPSPQGAIREPALLQHLIDETPDLTNEERVSLEERHRMAVRNALAVSLSVIGTQETRSIFNKNGHVLAPWLRLRWSIVSCLPTPAARTILRIKR